MKLNFAKMEAVAACRETLYATEMEALQAAKRMVPQMVR